MQFGPECLSKLCQFASDADAFLDEDGGGGQGGAAGALTAEDQLAMLMEVGPLGGEAGACLHAVRSRHNYLSCASCLQPESHYDDAGGCRAFSFLHTVIPVYSMNRFAPGFCCK